MPGTVQAFADLDGDQHQDFVVAQRTENQYRISIILSSHSDITALSPTAVFGRFTVQIGDINDDRVPDIIVRSPAALHPVAIWLGKGKGSFEAADHTVFQDGLRLTHSTAYRGSSLQVDQDFILDRSDPVCEKMNLVLVDSDPEPDGSISEGTTPIVVPKQYCRPTLRSPPDHILF